MKYVCTVCGYVYEGESLPADYVCPVCKGEQSKAYSDDAPLGTSVLPIDPLMTFFTLHSQKLSRLG